MTLRSPTHDTGVGAEIKSAPGPEFAKNRDIQLYKQNSVLKYGPMALTHGVAGERAEYFNVPSSVGIHGPVAVYERRPAPFKRHANARLYSESS